LNSEPQMNTDPKGRTPALLRCALDHRLVNGFPPRQSAAQEASDLCPSVFLCGYIELLRHRLSRMGSQAACFVALLLLLVGGHIQAADWVRAGLNTNQPLWGVRGGLLWAIPPGGFRAASGPRGLIRAGYPVGLPLRTLSCVSASTTAKSSSSASPARRRSSYSTDTSPA
jgi:hypothetical protein